MPVAIVFLLRAVVLVLLWGFVVAAVVAVRHDVFGTRTPKLPAPAPPPAPAAAARGAKPAPAAKPQRNRRSATAASQVVVIEGAATGATVALSSLPVTIGRSADSSIVLADDYVSNHHARLVPRGAEWLVEDTGSTNGTFVGDTRVSAPIVVPVGGRIKIGRNVLEIR